MKKLGIALVSIYCILLLALIPKELSEYAIIGLVGYIPILLILSLTVLIQQKNYKGRFLLASLSVCSIALLLFARIFSDHSVRFWEYSEIVFFLATGFFLLAIGLVFWKLITSKTSIPQSVDMIILLIPITTFLILEFVHFKNYIHADKIDGIDLIAWELEENNILMLRELGVDHNDFYTSIYDTLEFGRTLKLIDSAYKQVVLWNGAFSPGYLNEKLQQPNSNNYQRSFPKLMKLIRTQLMMKSDSIEDASIKAELLNIHDKIFNDQVYGNSVLEFRFRCFIAKNRLIWLSYQKAKKSNDH